MFSRRQESRGLRLISKGTYATRIVRKPFFEQDLLHDWETGALVIQEPLQMFAEILHQMRAVRHLERMRQCSLDRIRIGDFTGLGSPRQFLGDA